MRLVELLWFFPLAVAIACVVGAVGRREPREIVHAAGRTLWTLVAVVAGVGLLIRLLVVFFV